MKLNLHSNLRFIEVILWPNTPIEVFRMPGYHIPSARRFIRIHQADSHLRLRLPLSVLPSPVKELSNIVIRALIHTELVYHPLPSDFRWQLTLLWLLLHLDNFSKLRWRWVTSVLTKLIICVQKLSVWIRFVLNNQKVFIVNILGPFN